MLALPSRRRKHFRSGGLESDLWGDCYDDKSLSDNSLLDFSSQESPEEPGRISCLSSGTVAKTLLGPAVVLFGGRREWANMKQYVRRLAVKEASPMPVHNSEYA
jgi:hypothetical protein